MKLFDYQDRFSSQKRAQGIRILPQPREPSVFKEEDARGCLKIAFRQLCVPLCGRFGPDEGGVAGYVDRIGTKYAAKGGGLCPKGYLWWIP